MNYKKIFLIGIILLVFINICAISANENITSINSDSADIQNIETDDEIKTSAPIEAEIIPINLENEYQSGNFTFKLGCPPKLIFLF